jgi:hypothetical protein
MFAAATAKKLSRCKRTHGADIDENFDYAMAQFRNNGCALQKLESSNQLSTTRP